MTLAVGHKDGDVVVVDCVREAKPPFSPEHTCSEFATLLRKYRVTQVIGDKYAGGFPPEQFKKFAVLFEQAAKPRSELYVDLLPLINSGRIELLDHPRLISQLCALERRSGRGRDTINHPPNGHDDLANAIAGLASLLIAKPSMDLYLRVMCDASADADDDPDGKRAFRMLQFGELLRRAGM
jgi:hypothetical protein